MRFSLYIKIKDMLTTLTEVFQYIQSGNDRELCMQLCLDSLEFIEAINKALNDNKNSISDRLIEQLELISEKINYFYRKYKDGSVEDCEFNILLDEVKVVQILFAQDVKLVYHIVFFAELGQKWDSMKSVYDAFKKRDDCSVKVVQTPIFRAVEKEAGEIETDVIYEDYLTHLGIKNIPYDDYDLSQELPDIGFISNPYEGVTLPQFWPENIAKYTKLVYIPYYTEMSINDASIQVNCELPVARHAWRIISQSEKVKDMHVRYSLKKGENVLVTGLPKWDGMCDSIISSNKFNEEWKRKLNNKKVFLWNSHFDINSQTSTFLEYGRSIIDLFSKNEDIALIWRPHPMTDTIFKLYLPEYADHWEESKSIVEGSGNMVLDTNNSYDIAFEFSDALISDYSSMIVQYLFTQKPILVLQKGNGAVANTEELVQTSLLEQAKNQSDIERFITNIKKGIDENLSKRMQIISDDLPYADGKIGEQVCHLLLAELQKQA
ncbi:CDP-glycerol glycerophosphotransferase family protein [Sporosarcina sp. 179-K 8C2 HS]|uniref:CDP-glycerol glycerophosphotransferase family protein n=1 Tax=Sporosarcina sp. 179-K 8C2 HS TaxID=3142387 RepID=UPI0039A262DA